MCLLGLKPWKRQLIKGRHMLEALNVADALNMLEQLMANTNQGYIRNLWS